MSFFYIMRGPLISTLFPYTTLFRSGCGPRGLAREVSPLPLTTRSFLPSGVTRTEDRKSTRLNSSHLGISYAVFCLKKKIHPADLAVRAVQNAVSVVSKGERASRQQT